MSATLQTMRSCLQWDGCKVQGRFKGEGNPSKNSVSQKREIARTDGQNPRLKPAKSCHQIQTKFLSQNKRK